MFSCRFLSCNCTVNAIPVKLMDFLFQDILTDLNAEAETIPVEPIKDEWLGHKGMVSAAVYILEKIKSEKLLQRAHNYRTAIGTKSYGLVIVGHSLGAGIASILGILLRNEYPNLMCYCYSPPGGLLR